MWRKFDLDKDERLRASRDKLKVPATTAETTPVSIAGLNPMLEFSQGPTRQGRKGS